jgi:hypothetical protein
MKLNLISDYQVLKSAAGYYIGRLCKDIGDEIFWQPYDRASGYFKTTEEAQWQLDNCF